MAAWAAAGLRGGSPPRVRGTVRRKIYELESKGITPACAGNRPAGYPPFPQCRDHPRVCGEQHEYCSCRAYHKGSPPRVRGTGIHHHADSAPSGITPACAGNSFFQYLCGFIIGDHPRVCGEQITKQCNTRAFLGSPPRVRGTDAASPDEMARLGITPACAGNSRAPSHYRLPAQDHPRVCGEQLR